MRTASMAIALTAAVLLAACGDDEGDVGSPAPTSAAPTTAPSTTAVDGSTSTSGAVTTAAPTTTGPAVDDRELPEDQQGYTSALVRAWGAGDRAAAAPYATEEAVTALFAVADPGGGDWELVGCDNAGPRPACTFSSAAADDRLVLFYDAELLGRPRAVVDLDVLPGAVG